MTNKSKGFLGNDNVRVFKLGDSDVKLYLGDVLVYPINSWDIITKFNVTDTSNPTLIGYNEYISGFSAIEIDGVEQPTVVSAYTFDSIGEHTVKYTLVDPTSIGTYAFRECSGLTSVTIPDSVTSIGRSAFSWCTSLTSMTIPNSVTSIGINAFGGCSNLTSINIPSGVTSINNWVFASCRSLTSVNIPSGVTSIGTNAFEYCVNLTSIDIPSGVTTIGASAFTSCSGLTSITVNAATPPTLGSDAFLNTNNCPIYVPCDSVDAYKAASGWSDYASRIDAIYRESITNAVVTCDNATYNGAVQTAQNIAVTLSGKTLVANTDYTVTSNTGGTNAGSYTVVVGGVGCYSGTSNGTFTIAKADSSLSFTVTDLTVGIGETKTNAVTVNAGDGTVTYTSNNTSIVTVNNNGVVTGVGVGNTTVSANISSTSNYNSASTSYSVSCAAVLTAKYNVTGTSNPTMIASSTRSFTKIEIDGVEQPSVSTGYTFNTTGEHTVKYYLNSTSIGSEAFRACSSLTSIGIPSGVTRIGNNAFHGCNSLTSIEIPSGVTSIGSEAFRACSSLTSIEIPSGVTSIGQSTFQNCSGLTSIDIPDSVTSIGNSVFYECRSLTSIVIPSGVTTIGIECFKNCYSLPSIVIPSSVTSIGSNAFTNCSSLPSIDIPDSVTSIGNDTFSNCKSLTTCTIGSGVTSIGTQAFYGCSRLISIVMPSGVTSIGNSTFGYCSSLTSINIPNSVTSIDNYAFHGCRSLTSIVIPSGVTSIGDNAFYRCSGLTSIISNATTAPTISSSTFRDVKTGGTLTVPSGSSGYDVWMGTGNYYLGKYGWNKREYVEIASTKWATMNVGANSVTDTGLYFQWGDTSGYTASQVGSGSGQKYFGWADYKYITNAETSSSAFTKYNSTDGKTVLDASDDAAVANLGGAWRMPTREEYLALGAAVNSAWTTDYQGSGVSGLVLTDKTDSSKVLFFPAAGYCYNGSVGSANNYGGYWHSSFNSSDTSHSYVLELNRTNVYWSAIAYRCDGFLVRPVLD